MNSRRSLNPQRRTCARKGAKVEIAAGHELPNGSRGKREAEPRHGAPSQFSVRERYNKQSQEENRERERRKGHRQAQNAARTVNARVHEVKERLKGARSRRDQEMKQKHLKT